MAIPLPGFLYNMGKDLFLTWKNRNVLKVIDPIVLSSTDIKPLVKDGIIVGNADDYSLSKPERMYERTEGNQPSHEVVWIEDQKAKTKRQVVVKRYDGNIELVLLKRK